MDRLLAYRFIEQIKALPFVEAIYLYGSRARNTHRPRSDIDLAIVCPTAGNEEWQQVLDIVAEADTLLEIDCLRLDAEPQRSRLRQNIEKDHQVIHERS
ncbi:MAG: nucleotidyltransferase domain-containing protein [Magnetococcales bacterium]|nr:nucleotidyltransferase domain-containing protein [Magnetococcales bacterium]